MKILIAEVKKKCKYINIETWFSNLFVSFDRDNLKSEIEKHHKIVLKKDKKNEFPYFTDGGFKYSCENKDWLFEIEAHWYNVIK